MKIRTDKILVMALFLLLVTTSLAFAENNVQVTVNRSTEENNTIAVYTMEIAENSGMQSGGFVLSYDPEQLEYVSEELGSIATIGSALCAKYHNPDEHTIKLGYASTEPCKQGGILMTARFKVKNPDAIENAVLGLSVDSMTNGESAPITAAIQGDSVKPLDSGVSITGEVIASSKDLDVPQTSDITVTEPQETVKGVMDSGNLTTDKAAISGMGAVAAVILLVLLAGISFFIKNKKIK